MSIETVSAVPARHKKDRNSIKVKHKTPIKNRNKKDKKKIQKKKIQKKEMIKKSKIVAPNDKISSINNVNQVSPSIKNAELINQDSESIIGLLTKHKGKIAGAAALGLAGLGYQHRDKLNGLWNKDVAPAPHQSAYMKYGSLVKNRVRELATAITKNNGMLDKAWPYINPVGYTVSALGAGLALKKFWRNPEKQKNNVDIDELSLELISESKDGHSENVQKLLQHSKINVNKADDLEKTALIWASENGHTEIVQSLLQQPGIDVNKASKANQTALILASLKNQTEIVQELLKRKDIDVNKANRYGITALIGASFNNHTHIVQELLKHPKIDVNKADIDRNTLLILESFNNHTEIVKELLKRKDIDVNRANKDQRTALIYASMNNHTQIVKELLKPASIWTSILKYLPILTRFLRPEINVNMADKDGYTALIWASYQGHSGIVQELLQKPGIEVSKKDNEGKTALDWASGNRHEDICEFLRKRK